MIPMDLRLAVRSLWQWRLPAFCAALTLALGIGANATLFGVVDRLVLSPPPHVIHPSRVVRMYFSGVSFGRPYRSDIASFPYFDDLRRDATAFQEVAGYLPADVDIGDGESAIRAS